MLHFPSLKLYKHIKLALLPPILSITNVYSCFTSPSSCDNSGHYTMPSQIRSIHHVIPSTACIFKVIIIASPCIPCYDIIVQYVNYSKREPYYIIRGCYYVELKDLVERYQSAITHVYRRVNIILKEKIQSDITTDLFTTLHFIYKRKKCTSTEIATEFGIGKSAVTTAN